LKAYRYQLGKEEKSIVVPANINYALLTLKNGKTRKQEFYYGEGYLSQRSRKLILNKELIGEDFLKFFGNNHPSKTKN